jgi:hypothetical protein
MGRSKSREVAWYTCLEQHRQYRGTQKHDSRAERMCSGKGGGRRGEVVESLRKTVQDHWLQWLISDACADQLTDPAQGR